VLAAGGVFPFRLFLFFVFFFVFLPGLFGSVSPSTALGAIEAPSCCLADAVDFVVAAAGTFTCISLEGVSGLILLGWRKIQFAL
jgi:hypothetical protein